jgi:glycosyltransferase involved in cell wall biosynthesis
LSPKIKEDGKLGRVLSKLTLFAASAIIDLMATHDKRDSIWRQEGGRVGITVIIPAFNEAEAITRVISDIPQKLVSEVVVVNNNSTDATAERARGAGATVLDEPRQGYGFACLRGIGYLRAKPVTERPQVVTFLDGDYSDYPEEMSSLVKPVVAGECDLAIGARVQRSKGAMPGHQVLGNWLALMLIRLFYGVRFTDLGPFRAIRFDRLLALDMKDQTYGWTVEMQVKAVKQGLRICEVPVSYRARIGQSKISGGLGSSLRAGYRMITTILRYR